MISPEERWRLSAVSSFAAFMVAVWLALFVPYVNPVVAWIAAVIFAADAYVKWEDLREYRPYTSLLFSFANAALIFAGFLFAGEPWSYVFAVLWLIDAVLKIPGVDTKWEGRFRHFFSALNTTLLGLSLLFGVRVFGSFILSLVLGWLVLADAYVKWVYLKDRQFVVS